jgi:hypothetical protein
MKIRIPLLLVTAVCMVVLSATPAMAFTEFLQKKGDAGYQTKGGKQIFKTKAGTVECAEEKGTGSSAEEKSSQSFAEANYEKCLGSFGKEFKGVSVSVTSGQYNFHANGTVSIQNKITFSAEVVGFKCEVEVNREGEGEGKDSELAGISYTNNSPGITIKAAMKENITYNVLKNAGGQCGTTGTAKNGSYEGEAKTEKYASLICVYYPLGQYKDFRCTKAVLDGQYKRQGAYENLEVK